METGMQELEDRWILPLRGHTVTRIEPGAQTVFVLDSGVRIIVGEHAYFTDGPLGVTETVRPELAELDPDEVRKSIGTHVVSAVAFKSGALRIVLKDGRHLIVTHAQPLVPAAVVSGETVLWKRDIPSAET
jgi:hypothetical protein